MTEIHQVEVLTTTSHSEIRETGSERLLNDQMNLKLVHLDNARPRDGKVRILRGKERTLWDYIQVRTCISHSKQTRLSVQQLKTLVGVLEPVRKHIPHTSLPVKNISDSE